MKHFTIKSRLYIIYYAIIAIQALACFVFFQYDYPYHFFYKEQNQIFLMSWSYIATYFTKPAWAACLIGDFLTQFYYYLYAGAIILTLSLLTMGDIIRRALQRAGLHAGISFFIAIIAMILEAVCHFKAEFRLASTMSVIGGAAMFFAVSYIIRMDRIRKLRFMNDAIIVTFTAITYWMFGYGWIVFVLFSMISGWIFISWKTGVGRIIYIPLFILCIPLTQKQYLLNAKENYTYPGIGELAKPEMELEDYLAVDNEYYFGHYNEVMYMCGKMDTIPEQMSFFYNLALAQKGQLANYVSLDRPTNLGTFYHVNSKTPILIIKMTNELYYVLGDMTLTERAAMLANVFSPDNRNVRMIKRLAEANLISNDIPAATKYLRILDNTLVYKQWAADHTPGMQTPDVKAEIAKKRQYINKTDTLRLNDNCRMVLLELLKSNPRNEIALDYLLCSDLQAHEIGVFMDDYNKYYALQKRSMQPLLYRQAVDFYNQNNPNKKQK